MIVIFGSSAVAQEDTAKNKTSKITTTEFKVRGVCGMCEKRIEKAALIKGVKLADWDKDSNVIKVIFNNKKTSAENIKKAIAAVGHDAGDEIAKDKVYNELPGCCAYREEGIKIH